MFDVDNTLLDNDRFAADLGERLTQAFGVAGRERYWAIYDRLRRELDYADYLGALQRLRLEVDDDPDLLQMSAFMLEYPFASRLYPRSRNAWMGWGVSLYLLGFIVAAQVATVV